MPRSVGRAGDTAISRSGLSGIRSQSGLLADARVSTCSRPIAFSDALCPPTSKHADLRRSLTVQYSPSIEHWIRMCEKLRRPSACPWGLRSLQGHRRCAQQGAGPVARITSSARLLGHRPNICACRRRPCREASIDASPTEQIDSANVDCTKAMDRNLSPAQALVATSRFNQPAAGIAATLPRPPAAGGRRHNIGNAIDTKAINSGRFNQKGIAIAHHNIGNAYLRLRR